ncbi:protein-L-isoaspartate O-methyltransferase [Pigmentiphaga soli]|uniref:Protein-L-isoaspartate O-methyltransferase n=1 Tax=Pigmentiphaga soli TaxID=1007095 RepID=A0ABP8H3C5_9BURK
MNAVVNLPDIEQARFNMVEQQIRPWDVLDQNVLDLLFRVKREEFVPPALRSLAFADTDIPLKFDDFDTGECMLAPKVEARLQQELSLKPTDSVLEIGTGSGYQTALLASQARTVTSVEILPRLSAFAKENLKRAGITNAELQVGDGSKGWGSTEYDAILVTGSVPEVPDSLKYQLRVGGRLVIIVGQAPVMTAWLIVRTTAASFETTSLFETLVKPLRGVSVSKFKF